MSEVIDSLLAAESVGERKSFTVEQYNRAVEKKMREFPRTWVKGVLTQVDRRGKAVYLALADFAEGDARPRAVLSLVIWSNEFDAYAARFGLLATPFELKTGLKVSFLVESSFYVPTGRFQPRVADIDESYTLGELAVTRQRILEMLRREGLLDLNKQKTLAPVPLRIGLISAPGSAAYQDFTTVLLQSGFAFRIVFAEARMQGQATEETVTRALSALSSQPLDVICLVRGGGSKTDLVYFDSEKICRAIAACPVPVLTGIGHEIDECLADRVAYRYFLTPTDCAKFLEGLVEDAWNGLVRRSADLKSSWLQALQEQAYELHQRGDALRARWDARARGEAERQAFVAKRVVFVTHRFIKGCGDRLTADQRGLLRGPPKTLLLARERFVARARAVKRSWRDRAREAESGQARVSRSLAAAARRLLGLSRQHLDRGAIGLARGPVKILARISESLESKGRVLQYVDPVSLLRRGYAQVFSAAGKWIPGAGQVGEGEAILIRFSDGDVKASVNAKEMKE